MPVSLRKRSRPTLADWLKDRSNFPPSRYDAGRKYSPGRSEAGGPAANGQLNRAKERSGSS